MKIKTKLLLFIAVAVILGTVGILFFYVTNLQLNGIAEKGRFAENLIQRTFELSAISDEYLLNRTERAREQWLIVHEEVEGILEKKALHQPAAAAYLENLKKLRPELKQIFLELISAESQPGEDILSSRLLLKSREFASEADLLAELAFSERQTIRNKSDTIISILFLLFVLGSVSMTIVFYRMIGLPIQKLYKGTEIIAGGNLDYHLEVGHRNDELGQLGRAFNSMTEKLRLKAEQLAVIAKEKEDVRRKLVVTAEELKLKAQALAVTAKEKEDVRLKLVVTAKKLKESQDELARKEKLATLGKLAGIMGHEIRNPLGVIRNSIYFLTMKFGESMDEKVKRHMDILRSEIDGVDKIISDVLEFARTRPPSFTETEINSVVKASLSKASIPKTVKVKTDFGENLPKLNIDRAQIQQVFFNIISNAIEAMPKGGELQVTTSQTDTFISIAFKDTGMGISKENISKLFEPLFSTKPKGLGLGLAACQNIITLHQGKIEFERKEGQGATFIITLPIYKN